MSDESRGRDTEPDLWSALLVDVTAPIDRDVMAMVVRDQQQRSRLWLYPIVAVVSPLVVLVIRISRRVIGDRWAMHGLMDRLCVLFVGRAMSRDAALLLVRHFTIEANLLNFVIRNACPGRIEEITSVPTSAAELGDRAVIEHDLELYEVLTDLGRARTGDPAARPPRLPVARPDVSMLTVPDLDVGPVLRRRLGLDIQTSLCLMNIPFAACLTSAEYRRAVHSMRLDETLLGVLSMITGDPTFRAWRPGGGLVRVDSTANVPRSVYEHAVICEYAHARLLDLAVQTAQAAADQASASTDRAAAPSSCPYAGPWPAAWTASGWS